MNTSVLDHDTSHHDFGAADQVVEVRRHAPLAAGVGLTAAVIAIAYLSRAFGSGSLLDWVLVLVMGTIAAVHLSALVDARAPLLVADRHGIRLRTGPQWRGIAWSEVTQVEHHPRRAPFVDGHLLVVGAPDQDLRVPLSLSTRVVGCQSGELTAVLSALAGAEADVVEVAPEVNGDEDLQDPQDPQDPQEQQDCREPFDVEQSWDDVETGEQARIPDEETPEPATDLEDTAARPLVPSETPSPARMPVVASRVHTSAVREPRVDDSGPVTEAYRFDAGALEGDHSPEPTSPMPEPVSDPVVGSVLSTARVRLGLSVDQVADRTRIRPHVIEAIEVDDFAPCGGDFYARGHLRTLARVLGADAAGLLADYDARYADGPIDPRRVFEAELATGSGSIRATRGGPNWSVLVAAVMAVVLVWSIARLIMDGPVPIDDAPVLNGSPSRAGQNADTAAQVPVELTAVGGGASVEVRDATQKVVYDGNVAFGQTIALDAVPPVRVSSSDGSLTVSIDGQDPTTLGATGQEAQDTFIVR